MNCTDFATKTIETREGRRKKEAEAAAAKRQRELRAEVRKLGNEYVFFMLDDAIELLPPAKLHKIRRSTSI